jgi:hypothetical protein
MDQAVCWVVENCVVSVIAHAQDAKDRNEKVDTSYCLLTLDINLSAAKGQDQKLGVNGIEIFIYLSVLTPLMGNISQLPQSIRTNAAVA